MRRINFILSHLDRKNAREVCIQGKQNRTDSSACKHVVAWAVKEIICCNIQLQNGAPRHRYMLCEVAVTVFYSASP